MYQCLEWDSKPTNSEFECTEILNVFFTQYNIDHCCTNATFEATVCYNNATVSLFYSCDPISLLRSVFQQRVPFPLLHNILFRSLLLHCSTILLCNMVLQQCNHDANCYTIVILVMRFAHLLGKSWPTGRRGRCNSSSLTLASSVCRTRN